MDNMSDDRRGDIYYWIKIRQDLMQSKEMKLLMRQPDGGWYFSIYIYLVMLSINSNGRLIQKVGKMEMVYDLTMITQELMFFKIDTIRVAIEMLKSLNLLYEDEEKVICISNFSNMVGSMTGWAEIKRKQREKEKQLKLNNDVDNVHHDVHSNVHIEIRDKRLEYRDNNKDIRSIDQNDRNDKYDIYDKITFASDSEIQNYFKNLKINEWHIVFSQSHVLTKYLVYSKYFDEGDLDALISSNAFFENYLESTYDFEDLKKHVQYFLYQYRKMRLSDKNKIKNKMGYLTNAIKKNQKGIEWRSSDEYKKISKIEITVDKKLKSDAKELFPDDELMQELFCKERYLTYHGNELKDLRNEFERKSSVKG